MTFEDDLSRPLDAFAGPAEAADGKVRPRLVLVPKTAKERRFGRLSLNEVRARPVKGPDFIIDDWLVAREQSFIAGEPQCGKSFLAMHAALSIATGQDFFGRKVQQGLVIYQAGESGTGVLDQRIPAWVQRYGDGVITPDTPFEILPSKIDLFNGDSTDTSELIAAIKAICAERPNVPLRALFIDTLAKAMRGGDEIKGLDIGRVLANVERISNETGAHVCLIHHLPKGGSTLRGHGSLKGDVDCVAMVIQDQTTKVRTMFFDKMKDGPASERLQFELESTIIGEREDGKQITSCVCVPLGAREVAEKREAARGFNLVAQRNEPAVFAAFWKAKETKGIFASADHEATEGLPPGTILVHYKDWAEAYISGLADDNDKASTAEAVRKVWERNSQGLRKYSILGYSRPFMWWTGRPVRGYPTTTGRLPEPDYPPPVEDEIGF